MYGSNGRDIHDFHVCHIVIAIFCSTSSLGWDGTFSLVSYLYYICQVNSSTIKFVLEMSNCVLR